jgi:hypothetical protein
VSASSWPFISGSLRCIALRLRSPATTWAETALRGNALIHLNDRALRRRAKELYAASQQPVDPDSSALLLFYAAECGLKALYLRYYKLRDTGADSASARPASWYNHRLDDLIIALRIAERIVPPRPTSLTLRDGLTTSVDSLHQVWRYGAVLEPAAPVLAWLQKVVEYVIRELR